VYTIWYSYLLNSDKHSQPTGAIECAYLPIATFTTRGYGDIPVKTNALKIACGSEAALGAFILGLFVAGFANKSRY